MADISDVVLQLGSIGLWLQTIGVVIIIWIALQITNWIINRKRLKRLDELSERIDRIEKKIDKVLKK
ncbi:MAG: hypothetical protein KKD18_06685 [Nanoarchaeota archaeon]|nr:hypothetical protein [Nanoarchaeota archaeon]MBU0978079.1 hypothetical protein [Nanoarchaeota archaeon]